MRYVVDSIARVGGTTFGSETAEIINLEYPRQVDPGEPFWILYDGWNKTAEVLAMFGYIEHLDPPYEILGYWQANVDGDSTYAGDYHFSNGIQDTLSAQIVLGHIVPAVCENIYTPDECKSEGCWWYNDGCHTSYPACGEIGNAGDCVDYGCEWYGGRCHEPAGPTCENITDMQECVAAGCDWYDNSCHTPPSGIPWVYIIPVAAVVGIGLIVGIWKKKG